MIKKLRNKYSWINYLDVKNDIQNDINYKMVAQDKNPFAVSKLSQSIVQFQKKYPLEKKQIDLSNLGKKTQFENDWDKIETLKHGLSHIVENPGIYTMDELKKFLPQKQYDFLKNIPQQEELHLDRIPPYFQPSQDQNLINFSIQHKCKYLMSTSSMTSFLSQIHFIISQFQEANYNCLPFHNTQFKARYMSMLKKPSSISMTKVNNNLYAIDGGLSRFYPDNMVLLQLGKVLERILTMDVDDFNEIFKSEQTDQIMEQDFHRINVVNDEIGLRSQLDTKQQINGQNISFEIKTRALAPLRYDIENYQQYLDYELKQNIGLIYSYEREFYDLIRGGFMKYYYQMKIGDMDGAFLAYHNTKNIFGYEYIKLTQIEKILFQNEFKGKLSFFLGSKIGVVILDEIKQHYNFDNFKSLEIGFYADSTKDRLIVFVEEIDQEEYDQCKNIQLIKQKGMYSIGNYYDKKVQDGKQIKVKKFEFEFYPILNNIENKFFYQDIKEGDTLQLYYTVIKFDQVQLKEYKLFLNQVDKQKDTILDRRKYNGNWLNANYQYEL